MQYTTDFNDIYELSKVTWSGANDTVEGIIKLDAEYGTDYAERLISYLEEVFMDDVPSITSINDFLWFETDNIYEAIGLNSDGEIPNAVDEARANGDIWYIAREDLKELEDSGLFSEDTINFLKENTAEDSSYYLDFDELEKNESEVTEEQIEFLNHI